jgi:PhnB protein
MKVEPYLFFYGRCDEAIEFYTKALRAEVTSLMRFKEAPDQSMVAPGWGEKVMHAAFKVGDTTVMASDGHTAEGKLNFQGFALTIQVASEAEADRFFKALSEGGHVRQPLSKTFFSAKFGMVTDRFGVLWMVII